MHFDWGTPAADAALRLSELVVSIDLAAYARFADAQEGLGVLSKIYTSTQAHLDVLEVALPRCPVPSPFMIGAGELVIPSTFLAPAMPAVLAVPFVPAVAATVAVAAVARCVPELVSLRCALHVLYRPSQHGPRSLRWLVDPSCRRPLLQTWSGFTWSGSVRGWT